MKCRMEKCEINAITQVYPVGFLKDTALVISKNVKFQLDFRDRYYSVQHCSMCKVNSKQGKRFPTYSNRSSKTKMEKDKLPSCLNTSDDKIY